MPPCDGFASENNPGFFLPRVNKVVILVDSDLLDKGCCAKWRFWSFWVIKVVIPGLSLLDTEYSLT